MNSDQIQFHGLVLGVFIAVLIGASVFFARQPKEKKEAFFHKLLGVICGGTLLLIFVGAMVASTRSGMAFMDWPTSNGLIWPDLDQWVHQRDMFWEHFHRLIAEGVGFLAICLLVWSFFVHDKKFLKASIILLVIIIIQGIFGGLTVKKLTAWWTSTLHGAVAQLVFAYMLVLFFKAGKKLQGHTPVIDDDSWLRSLPKVVFTIVLIQLLLGASFRHRMKVAQFSSSLSESELKTLVEQPKSFSFNQPGVYALQVKAGEAQQFSATIKDKAGVGGELEKEIKAEAAGELVTVGEFLVKEGTSYSITFKAALQEIRLVGPERVKLGGEELDFQIVYKEVLDGNRHLLWAHIGFAIIVTVFVLLLGIYLMRKKQSLAVLGTIGLGLIISLVIQLFLGLMALVTVNERQNNIYDQMKTILTSAHLANGALVLGLCALAFYFCRAGFVKSESGE